MSRIWIDTHIHVSDIGRDGKKRERMLAGLLDVLDRSDADLRFVISCTFPYLARMMNDPAQMLAANRMVYELVRQAPDRLHGSCCINPNFLEESLRVMDTCLGEWGFVQLGEMLQYMMKYEMDSDSVGRLVRHAVGYGVPVQVHISTSNVKEHPSSFGAEQIEDLMNAAEKAPEANYILAHAVGGSKDNPPVVDEYLDMVEKRYGRWPDNFWMEISDFSSPGVRSALARVPCRRILAGTDWWTNTDAPFPPYGAVFAGQGKENPFPPTVESFVKFLREAGASEQDIARIGFENARELLRIE